MVKSKRDGRLPLWRAPRFHKGIVVLVVFVDYIWRVAYAVAVLIFSSIVAPVVSFTAVIPRV